MKNINKNLDYEIQNALNYLQSAINPELIDNAITTYSKGNYGYNKELQRLFDATIAYNPKLQSLIINRYSAVLGLEYEVNYENVPTKIKNYVKDLLKYTPLHIIIGNSLNALLRKFSICELFFEYSNGKYYIKDIKMHPCRYFEKSKFDNNFYLIPDNNSGFKATANSKNYYDSSFKINYDKVLVEQEPFFEMPLFTGILKLDIAKWWSITNWVRKNELAGKAGLIAKIPNGCDENSVEYQMAIKALKSIDENNWGVIWESTIIEDLNFNIQATQSFSSIIEYFDKLYSILILGQYATTEGANSTFASSKTQAEIAGKNIVKTDVIFVNNSINNFIEKMVRFTFGDVSNIDLPKYRLISDDLYENAKLDAMLFNMGFVPKKEYFQNVYKKDPNLFEVRDITNSKNEYTMEDNRLKTSDSPYND